MIRKPTSTRPSSTPSTQPAADARDARPSWSALPLSAPPGSATAAKGGAGNSNRPWRVAKTMQPDDRGALQLARTYGPDLVCVRHRVDGDGRTRHTTVELLIASAPIEHRKPPMVRLKLERHERELRAIIMKAGGKWDPHSQLWSLPRRLAKILNLQTRIVPASG